MLAYKDELTTLYVVISIATLSISIYIQSKLTTPNDKRMRIQKNQHYNYKITLDWKIGAHEDCITPIIYQLFESPLIE